MMTKYAIYGALCLISYGYFYPWLCSVTGAQQHGLWWEIASLFASSSGYDIFAAMRNKLKL